jgi:predicted cupin superfamily sugar epimerase
MQTPEEIIAALGLEPHPEGGFYRETFRDSLGASGRAHATAIYYLLRASEVSRWHRVDTAEIWHWYAGEALELRIAQPGGVERAVLGPRLRMGERPQTVVPVRMWQSARPMGAYALVGCTVAPGFEFSGFEMAPEGWEPD